MLNAILHSKDKSFETKNIYNFRDLYKDIEDFFTATIFTRITYLPINIQKKIFNDLTSIDDFLVTSELKLREFWPKWGLENRLYVEPDLFLSYDNIDVIIESKRSDSTAHDSKQIDQEIQAYKNEHKEGKPFILLAIGGGCTLNTKTDKVLFYKWKDLYQSIINIYKNDIDGNFSNEIYKDIMEAFRLHGFYPYTWLDSLKYELIQEDINQILKWD